MVDNPHIGSSFDDYLAEQGTLAETEAVATKRVIAWQITERMKAENLSKKALAKRMHTSRPAVDRLLDPMNESVTLQTLRKAAEALGKRVRLELV
jgi:predicted XRE-type DNA-binding protein